MLVEAKTIQGTCTIGRVSFALDPSFVVCACGGRANTIHALSARSVASSILTARASFHIRLYRLAYAAMPLKKVAAAPKKGSKRKTATAVAAKVSKLHRELAELSSASKEAEQDLQLAEIVQELQRHLEQTPECRRAVLSDMFLPDASKDFFNKETIYFYKLPKYWVADWLGSRDAKLTSDSLKAAAKNDRGIHHKIFYRLTLSDKSSLLMTHNISQFNEIITDRFNEVRFPAKSIVLKSGASDILWEKCGVYILVPPRPSAHSGPWSYKGICFNNSVTINFDGSLPVTDQWKIRTIGASAAPCSSRRKEKPSA